jgi:hypothetical protein
MLFGHENDGGSYQKNQKEKLSELGNADWSL